MKSYTGKSISMPPCPHCEKGEYNLCGHKDIENKEKCEDCGKDMRKWFNQQIHTGYSCDNCGHSFALPNQNKIKECDCKEMTCEKGCKKNHYFLPEFLSVPRLIQAEHIDSGVCRLYLILFWFF